MDLRRVPFLRDEFRHVFYKANATVLWAVGVLVSVLVSILVIGMVLAIISGCGAYSMPNTGGELVNDADLPPADADGPLALATFGGGCFWCTEAVYQQLKGVHQVESGYAGGAAPNPTYEAVCSGTTGHAEVIQITYDPQVISYAKLLEVFWQSHDPTTPNRQGNDVGSQYRSIILTHDETQRDLATSAIERLNQEDVFGSPVVTEVVPLAEFYAAEAGHQDYYRTHGRQPYCGVVIQPKVEKIRKVFADSVHPLGD